MGWIPASLGTSPNPFSPSPWQMAQLIVLPEPPVVASASPFLILPCGTYAMNPECGSRLSTRAAS